VPRCEHTTKVPGMTRVLNRSHSFTGTPGEAATDLTVYVKNLVLLQLTKSEQ